MTLPTPSFFLSRSLTLELCKLLATFLVEGDADLLLLVVVKVAGVAWSFELGDKGSLHLQTIENPSWEVNFIEGKTTRLTSCTHRHTYLFLVDGNPVGGCEPFVSLDVVDPVLEVPKTFC